MISEKIQLWKRNSAPHLSVILPMCFRGGNNQFEIIFRLVEFVFRKRAVLNVNMLLFKTRMHEIFFLNSRINCSIVLRTILGWNCWCVTFTSLKWQWVISKLSLVCSNLLIFTPFEVINIYVYCCSGYIVYHKFILIIFILLRKFWS